MKNFTLFIAACILSASIYAQQFTIKEVVKSHSKFELTSTKSLDTLMAPVFYYFTSPSCADTLVYYNIGTGYLTGNGTISGMVMTECSQTFDNTISGNVIGAVVLLENISGTSGPFTAKAYTVDGTQKPTTALATSTPVDMSTLTPGADTVAFTFATPPVVTANFAVSVVYPTVTGDTIAIYQTNESCVDPAKDGYAYLNITGYGWISYKTLMGMQAPPMGSFDLLILAIVSSTTDIENNPLNATMNLYPNPADNNVTIACLNNMESVKVLNCLGQTLSDNVTDGLIYNLNTSQFDNGVYLVQIQTAKGLITRKFTINR